MLFFSFSFIIAQQFVSASEKPNYCHYFSSQSQKLEPNSSLDGQKSLRSCVGRVPFNIEIKRLSLLVKKIETKTLNQMGLQFTNRLKVSAIKNVIKGALQYDGVFSDINYQDKDLKSCSSSNSLAWQEIQKYREAKSQELDLEKQKTLIEINLINAIKAEALFQNNKSYYREKERSKHTFNRAVNQCNYKERKCRKSTSMLETTYHCSENKAECIRDIKLKKSSRDVFIESSAAPLFSMVQSSPLLFKNSNDGNPLAAFSTNKLRRSKMQKKYISKVPIAMIKDLSRLMKNENKKEVRTFFESQANKLNKIIKNKKNYNELQDVTKNAANSHVKRLNSALSSLCSGEGEKLHHYPAFVEDVMNEMYENSNTEYLENQIIASKAAYCHLLDVSPLSKSSVSLASISGFSMLGVGLALQFVPVVGNAFGTGLLVAGGAVLTGVGYSDYLTSEMKYQGDVAMYSAGYTGYNELIRAQKMRDENFAWSVADTVLVPLDLSVLRVMKSKKRVSKNLKSSKMSKNELQKFLKDFLNALSKSPGQKLTEKEMKVFFNINKYVKNEKLREQILSAIKKETKECRR